MNLKQLEKGEHLLALYAAGYKHSVEELRNWLFDHRGYLIRLARRHADRGADSTKESSDD